MSSMPLKGQVQDLGDGIDLRCLLVWAGMWEFLLQMPPNRQTKLVSHNGRSVVMVLVAGQASLERITKGKRKKKVVEVMEYGKPYHIPAKRAYRVHTEVYGANIIQIATGNLVPEDVIEESEEIHGQSQEGS